MWTYNFQRNYIQVLGLHNFFWEIGHPHSLVTIMLFCTGLYTPPLLCYITLEWPLTLVHRNMLRMAVSREPTCRLLNGNILGEHRPVGSPANCCWGTESQSWVQLHKITSITITITLKYRPQLQLQLHHHNVILNYNYNYTMFISITITITVPFLRK